MRTRKGYSKSDAAVQAIAEAALAVKVLMEAVDPGHISMLNYLDQLETRLITETYALRQRIEEESGG